MTRFAQNADVPSRSPRRDRALDNSLPRDQHGLLQLAGPVNDRVRMPGPAYHVRAEVLKGRLRGVTPSGNKLAGKSRELWLVIKAKLEAIENGIPIFLAYIALPDGQTLGAHVKPQVAAIYQSGRMLRLLPAPEGKQ